MADGLGLRSDLAAAATWDREESSAATSARIHDGVSDEPGLQARADAYVSQLLFGCFPEAVPEAGADILEIGSGLGWIMQAMDGFLRARARPPGRIVGLDIAPRMLAKARERIGAQPQFDFALYDGLAVPFDDASFDLIYSVACLQHVPRPYVFNLFFEFRRLLRPRGAAIVHLMSTDFLPKQHMSWRDEISNQITGREAHWHHFYTAKELRDVLAQTGFSHVSVYDDHGGTLAVLMADRAAGLPADRYGPPEQVLRERNAALQAERDALAARVAGLEASNSWRVTRPLRALSRMLGR